MDFSKACEILRFKEGDSVEPTLLKTRYRARARETHPDSLGASNSADFREASDAYEYLKSFIQIKSGKIYAQQTPPEAQPMGTPTPRKKKTKTQKTKTRQERSYAYPRTRYSKKFSEEIRDAERMESKNHFSSGYARESDVSSSDYNFDISFFRVTLSDTRYCLLKVMLRYAVVSVLLIIPAYFLKSNLFAVASLSLLPALALYLKFRTSLHSRIEFGREVISGYGILGNEQGLLWRIPRASVECIRITKNAITGLHDMRIRINGGQSVDVASMSLDSMHEILSYLEDFNLGAAA